MQQSVTPDCLLPVVAGSEGAGGLPVALNFGADVTGRGRAWRAVCGPR